MTIRVLYPFNGHVVGGSHLSALTLIRNLPPDIEPLIALAVNGPLSAYLDERSIKWIRLPPLTQAKNGSVKAEIARAVANASRLRRFLKDQRIDIVHSNEYDMNSLWPLAKTGLPVKHIWHQRSLNGSRRLAIYASFVDHYFTISAFCRDNMTPAVRKRADIVQNPIEITENDLSLKTDIGPRTPQTMRIGFVGHLDHQKRIMTFLSIAHKVTDRNQAEVKPSFYIFGDSKGPMAQEAEAYIQQANLNDVCFLMGQKFPVAPWIRDLDLLVAPAANEGLGRAVIEAQLLDVPVLASDSGGHRELIQDGKTGWLAPLDDIDGFSTKILEFIRHPALMRSVCRAASSQAAAQYGVSNHVGHVADVYRRLINS